MIEGGISSIPREARAYQGHRAGLVTRMVAAVLDAVVVGGALLAGYAGWCGLLFMLDPRGFSFPKVHLILSLTSWLIVTVVYLTVTWWATGRSYGCHVMGLRVVNFRGERLKLLGAGVRAILCVLVPIGLLWVAVSRQNRSLQDVLLRTSVVYDWQPRSH